MDSCPSYSDSPDGFYGDFPLFEPKWKASEEVALLEAVELYSYGNWGDISLFIPNKSSEEIEQHFMDYYIKGNLGKLSWDMVKNKANLVVDHTCTSEEGPLSPSLTQPNPTACEISPEQQQLLCYMPNRDDFEREFDNEVETLVATLSMNVKEEDDLDRDMKLAYIDIYNRRLSERFRRKEIVRQHGLVDLFFENLKEQNQGTTTANADDEPSDTKEISKQESNTSHQSTRSSSPKRKSTPTSSKGLSRAAKLQENFKIFTQFLTRSQLNEILSDLPREREVISRVKELIRYRRNGFRTFTKSLISERVKKDKRKENRKYEAHTGNTGSGLKSAAPTQRLHETEGVAGKSSTTSKINSSLKTSSKVSQQGTTSKDSKAFSSAHSGRRDEKDSHHQNTVDVKKSSSRVDRSDSMSSSTHGHKATKSTAYLMPGSKLLSERERRLCSLLHLGPTQYINLKTLIIKEHLRKKEKGTTKSALENVDKNIRRKLINFISKNGWIRNS